jgi:hypothetical protein
MKTTMRSLALAATVASLSLPAAAFPIDHLQDKSDIGKNKVPHEGTSHILVIPSRVGGPISPERLQALEEYFDPDGGPGTFRDFWQKTSGGRFDPIPYLADPVLYPDTCPLPGKTVQTCRILIEDLELLTSGAVQEAIEDLLRRVRDEQEIDLSQFDVNGIDADNPDGWFDGVILNTNIFDGLGLPLASFMQEVHIGVTPQPLPVAVDAGPDAGDLDAGAADAGAADGGAVADAGTVADAGSSVDAGPPDEMLGVGVVAFIPPDTHEFGHNLGFIDLYPPPDLPALATRPSTSGLMSAGDHRPERPQPAADRLGRCAQGDRRRGDAAAPRPRGRRDPAVRRGAALRAGGEPERLHPRPGG